MILVAQMTTLSLMSAKNVAWEQLSLFTWPSSSLHSLYITIYIWQLRQPSQVSTWIGDCQKIPELGGRNTEK